MKWYSNYLNYYNKPFVELPSQAIQQVKELLQTKTSDVPVVSVILIAHNEETHLLSCLWSLCNNYCSYPFEIITVNNNSTDKTEELLKLLEANYYNETKKGPGSARQCGLDHARGKYHVCIDADTIYPPLYIQTHIDLLKAPDVVATYSLWSFMSDESHSKLGLMLYESLRDLHLSIQAIKRPELNVRGMTFCFKTELGRKYGFRTDIKRGEDGYLALNLKNEGKLKFITSNKARVLTGNATLSNDGSLFNSFKNRLIKAFKNMGGLFTSKKHYKDKQDNLL